MSYNTTLEHKQISHRTTVNTLVPDMVTTPGEEPQKKQKKLQLHPRKGRDKTTKN